MPASVIWLKPLSKFVLEVSPLVSALLIAAYLVSGAHESDRPAGTAVVPPLADTAMLSGEEVTAMIKQAHAAVAAESREQAERIEAQIAPDASPQPNPVTAHAARSAKAVHGKAAKHSEPAAKLTETRPVPPLPGAAAQPAAKPAPERQGLLKRTWGTVAHWGGTVAHAARIDQAADMVAETPSAVARAGRKTWQAVTSILPDDPRR